MNINFHKYEGAGNDFILLDNRNSLFNRILHPKEIKKLCDRRFGVGADGLMVLQLKEGYDFEMLYYNSNGTEGTMCGNGGRCIVAFARHLGIIESETNFLAVDGPHHAKISEKDSWVRLKMKDVTELENDGSATILDTGSPHFVLLAKDLRNKDVFKEGRDIRYSDKYKLNGINVNFVEDRNSHYFVRTYERGVENETYACGTGATAVAMAMARIKRQTGNITTLIQVLGGELKVNFNYDGNNFKDVFLEGPVNYVFKGSINI